MTVGTGVDVYFRQMDHLLSEDLWPQNTVGGEEDMTNVVQRGLAARDVDRHQYTELVEKEGMLYVLREFVNQLASKERNVGRKKETKGNQD